MDVAVLGTTETGRALAGWCVRADMTVRLYGGDANDVMDSVGAVQRRAGVESRDRIDGTTGLEAAVAGADVVVDATDGGTDERRTLLAEAERHAERDALVAVCAIHDTVTAVAAGLRFPARAVGLHAVDPRGTEVAEVVVAEQTTADTRDRAVGFVERVGAVALVVRDAPGFVTTRLDLLAIAEAVRMVEGSVASVGDIDRAMELGRQHPVGPLGLADELGLETVLEALEVLAANLGSRFDPPDLLFEKVANGHRGKATGTGFYEWEHGERTGPADPNPTVEVRSADVGER